MHIAPDLQLTYCTNIHPGTGWAEVEANIRRFAPALKARLSPDAPFGLGLRLSAREACELLESSRLEAFKALLANEGLYVAIINGFPYGPFHGKSVKADAYAPDWRDRSRVQYTLDLVAILRALLPDGVDGGISTVPLSYKPWLRDGERGTFDWDLATRNVVQVAQALVRTREVDGTTIHLDIEPEPDCLIEHTDEAIAFFEGHLLGTGSTLLGHMLGLSAAEACDRLIDHVRICFDCCHAAVEYEDPPAALDRLRSAGLRIGRIQLSSALDVAFPEDPSGRRRTTSRLRAFADSTYLHQVIERRGAELAHFPDLDDALAGAEGRNPDQWRVHFHVPLFTHEFEGLSSTQSFVASALEYVRRTRVTRHLEIETYTWDVLPAGLKMELTESIAREYEWVLREMGSVTMPSV